jgi:hypothetical protein
MSYFWNSWKLLAIITRFHDRFDFYEFHEFFDTSKYIFIKINSNILDDNTYKVSLLGNCYNWGLRIERE